jgi:hypothetical protein
MSIFIELNKLNESKQTCEVYFWLESKNEIQGIGKNYLLMEYNKVKIIDRIKKPVFGYRVKFDIFLGFSYKSYPFDTQNVQLFFDPDSEVKLNSVNVRLSPDINNRWSLTKVIKEVYKIHVILTRRPLSTLYRFVLPLFIITSYCFCSYFIRYDDFPSRISNQLTILLTLTAFRFVIMSVIPDSGEQTMIDKYLLLCYGVYMIITIEILISSVWEFELLDRVLGRSFGCFWLILNILGLVLNAKKEKNHHRTLSAEGVTSDADEFFPIYSESQLATV